MRFSPLSATCLDHFGNELSGAFDRFICQPTILQRQTDANTQCGLSGSYARFLNASPIVVVWENCVARVEEVVVGPKRGNFVSWKRLPCGIELLTGLCSRIKAKD